MTVQVSAFWQQLFDNHRTHLLTAVSLNTFCHLFFYPVVLQIFIFENVEEISKFRNPVFPSYRVLAFSSLSKQKWNQQTVPEYKSTSTTKTPILKRSTQLKIDWTVSTQE